MDYYIWKMRFQKQFLDTLVSNCLQIISSYLSKDTGLCQTFCHIQVASCSLVEIKLSQQHCVLCKSLWTFREDRTLLSKRGTWLLVSDFSYPCFENSENLCLAVDGSRNVNFSRWRWLYWEKQYKFPVSERRIWLGSTLEIDLGWVFNLNIIPKLALEINSYSK